MGDKEKLHLNYIELEKTEIDAFRQLVGERRRTIKAQIELLIINELKKESKND